MQRDNTQCGEVKRKRSAVALHTLISAGLLLLLSECNANRSPVCRHPAPDTARQTPYGAKLKLDLSLIWSFFVVHCVL